MKRKPNINNPVDATIDNLISELSQVKNFNQLIESNGGKQLYEFILNTITGFNNFKTLFISNYLPESRRSAHKLRRYVKKSKYSSLIQLEEYEYLENYYETVRLGYVGLYHKYESYINKLPEVIDEFYSQEFADEKIEPLLKFMKKEFDINLGKSVKPFPIVHKINYICNCVKHYDSYPTKTPKPLSFVMYDSSEKIKIESKELKKDIEELIEHTNFILKILLTIVNYQFIKKELISNENDKEALEKINGALTLIERSILGIFGKKDKAFRPLQ